PQNIFLRVCVRDTLNEPIINGLFVFTTDHDELRFKGKPHATRLEDVNDLLAFGKVYFFTVRNYFVGLDQAREARDIGRLNQTLYDDRLTELDALMNCRAEAEPLRDRGMTDPGCWEKFVYEVLNHYAHSLVEKPGEVKIETFPYDRLLVLPLA